MLKKATFLLLIFFSLNCYTFFNPFDNNSVQGNDVEEEEGEGLFGFTDYFSSFFSIGYSNIDAEINDGFKYEQNYRTLIPTMEGGIYYKLTDKIHLGANVFLSYGSSNKALERFLTTGIGVGGTYFFRGFKILHTPYIKTAFGYSKTYIEVGEDLGELDFKSNGAYLSIGLGYMLRLNKKHTLALEFMINGMSGSYEYGHTIYTFNFTYTH